VRALGTDHASLVFACEEVLDESGVLDELLFFGESLEEAAEEGQRVVLLVW